MEKKESDNEKEDKEHAAVDEESKPSEELDAAQKNDNSSADVAFLYKTMRKKLTQLLDLFVHSFYYKCRFYEY